MTEGETTAEYSYSLFLDAKQILLIKQAVMIRTRHFAPNSFLPSMHKQTSQMEADKQTSPSQPKYALDIAHPLIACLHVRGITLYPAREFFLQCSEID